MKEHIPKLHSLVKSFPLELTQLILCALPDAVTLRALVLSHSSFYRAFVAGRHLITLQVLLNQISPDLLPDALAVLKSSRLKPWSRESITEFLTSYHGKRFSPSPAWTISDAVPVSMLHDDISFFMADFVSMALAVHPVTGVPDVFPSPLTSREEFRISQAFYRFELYCNLFRERGWKDDRFRPEEQQAIFFDQYSPWENEQLACVHDYLYRRMVAVYNEFAAHDIEWGEYQVKYGIYDWHAPENAWKQGTLSLGLNYLRRLVTAKTYEERYQLLAHNHRSDHYFLHEGLVASNGDDEEDDAIELCQYGSEDERRYIHSPFLNDADPGPAKAWRWAHEHVSRGSFVQYESHRELRERGYVMWDLARLEQWNLFEQAWRSGMEPRIDFVEEYRAMVRSFDARSEIYQRGGRGWWSEGDESKIVWKKQEPHRPRVHVINWP
ncbi:hypothetical protein MMC26_002339 [Xylographa opegraphella]|nr:hypothetical protein [Xylographa opegraphella]